MRESISGKPADNADNDSADSASDRVEVEVMGRSSGRGWSEVVRRTIGGGGGWRMRARPKCDLRGGVHSGPSYQALSTPKRRCRFGTNRRKMLLFRARGFRITLLFFFQP